GTIQLINTCPRKNCGRFPTLLGQRPELDAHGSCDSGADSGEHVGQSRSDTCAGASAERRCNRRYDTSRDHHVLERHNTVLVRAEMLQFLDDLKVITQHKIDPSLT